jgi:hypothetical protein
MKRWLMTWMTLATIPGGAMAQEAHSPYAHAGSGEIKTLSQQEVDDLRNGAGMGLARPAELNQYPGPRHVLELADSLALSAEQRQAVEATFADMQGRAKALGMQILDAEKALDGAFAAGGMTEEALASAVSEIARLQGELRTVHLRAHLATRDALTRHQIHEYDRLRGHRSGHAHSDDSTMG